MTTIEKKILDLEKQIEAQQRLIDHLLDEQNKGDTLDYSWTGNLGRWYWDVPTNTVTFNPLKAQALGYKLSELKQPIGFDFFTSKLHPDDYEPVMDNMRKHLYGETHVYDVEYRIKAKNGEYRFFYDRGVVTKRDALNRPLLLSGIVFDITERKQNEHQLLEEKERLLKRSITDELTKVFNYRGIIDDLKQAIQDLDYQDNLSILMLDIDDFKQVNDTYGHIKGDEILKTIATVIQKNLRKTDSVGRYGGEEFLVVFRNTGRIQAIEISNRIRKEVEQTVSIDQKPVTISGGVFEYPGSSLYDFIHQADINLYEAKKRGKNKIV
ncbi:sensor domain-containing diguanylate cyclase [Acholeplasma vituli]|uniref:Sensor domain-containing diguanylate cyclase n=1 Tax=Paracholeplasma vituli TaxID=69473 RepID=A0ABT2PVH2_9MOLU|nr:sensor domain-containing diguanylate cyclase [Paracholeplasma vituli]MCU0104953.1 sensor domain-containing diguanylate cyclase [Paracholeplasma vituli]